MENKSEGRHKADAHEVFVIEAEVETSRFDGAKYPGIALAWVIEAPPENFIIIPFSLKEIGGFHVSWSDPEPQSPIRTKKPITNWSEANRLFAKWAQRTYERNWESTATRAARLIREAMSEL